MTSDNANGVFVAKTDGVVFIRVVGRGTYQNAQPLRQFGRESMDRGCKTFHVDLEQCHGLDSTFLGVLAGFGLKLRALGGLHLFNARGHNFQSCQLLGLDRLGHLESGPPDASSHPLPLQSEFHKLPDTDLSILTGPANKEATTRSMLEAHEDLCRADERNESKFKDVNQFLRQEIARKAARENKEN